MKLQKTFYLAAFIAIAIAMTLGLKIAENANRIAKVEQVATSCLGLNRM